MRGLKRIWARVAVFLTVMGPGIITGNVDNDAGGIASYSVAGARYGYEMLWALVLVTLALSMIQEMNARMGVVTGKGLADLIREEFGLKVTVLTMAALTFSNATTTMAEFAGVAAAAEILGVSRYVAVPLVAVFVWQLVLRGSYRVVEKFFLVFCLLFATYIMSGFIARPDWSEVFRNVVTPSFRMEIGYITALLAVIGSTTAPWMQFYQQAAVRDKGIRLEHYSLEKLDTYVGVFVMNVVAFFIIVCCAATLHKAGVWVNDAAEAALALEPLAGRYASVLFALGLLNASVMAASILPLSTAYALSEALGFEAALGAPFSDAPAFYTIYSVLVFASAAAVLIPGINLIGVMVASQAIQGVLLPAILVLMLKLCNDRTLMGNHVNSWLANLVVGAQAVAMTLLIVLMAVSWLKGNPL